MTDTDQQRGRKASDKVANQTEGGRYGNAPDHEPHVSPETPPVRGADPPVHVPEATPGALPENMGRRPEAHAGDDGTEQDH